MIDLTINEEQLKRSVERCRERNIVIPTFEEQKYPEKAPEAIKNKLRNTGLWDIVPENLFRISWKNEPVESGGGYGRVNYLELPSALTGVDARIVCLVGKWFPTGAHKVGASFGCLVPRLVTGQFDITSHKAVWPSTGNYCRGGAYDSALLGCKSIAILPEGMSQERFDWLAKVADEVIATPGCESNVKEIYDKCWELRATRDDIMIFNQFEEFGNHLWHYDITGHAMCEVLGEVMGPGDRYAGLTSSTGSAGTIGCGDFMKEQYPNSKIAACEALQCPTLLLNGFGGHRIEGIGDKHVPWIHNVRNTDMIIAADDEDCMRILRLCNEPAGREYLLSQGVPADMVDKLDLIGISGIGNIVCAIKLARYYELTSKDVVLTILTDSMELYGSRIKELREQFGEYRREDAVRDYHKSILGQSKDNMLELSFYDKKRIHNLKYFTWIEQQARDLDELNEQWYNWEEYWGTIHAMVPEIDKRIEEFNSMTGLLG